MTTANNQMVNAWIFLNEDEPAGTDYNSPNSSYQALIQNNVYQAIDTLYLCFVTTLPTSSTTVPTGDGSSYTIAMGAAQHNQPYMENILRDAPANNPNIKICVTLNWGDADTISNIFSNTNNTPEQNAANFAANLVTYMNYYNLDGFDIDWESPISGTDPTQMKLLLCAIGAEFKQITGKHFYLTLSPVTAENLDGDTVNNNVDFLNLQLYGGTSPEEYTQIGINENLLAYGAKFEANFQTAQDAFSDNQQNYHFSIFTNWRLNSTNFDFEQSQQKALYQLVFP